MIRHRVRVRFSAQAGAQARNRALGSLIALGDHLGHVESFSCGPEADPEARAAGFTHAFAVVLETQAALDRYRALPEYAAAMALIAEASEAGGDGIAVATDPCG